jgi:hypothetical protein
MTYLFPAFLSGVLLAWLIYRSERKQLIRELEVQRLNNDLLCGFYDDLTEEANRLVDEVQDVKRIYAEHLAKHECEVKDGVLNAEVIG